MRQQDLNANRTLLCQDVVVIDRVCRRSVTEATKDGLETVAYNYFSEYRRFESISSTEESCKLSVPQQWSPRRSWLCRRACGFGCDSSVSGVRGQHFVQDLCHCRASCSQVPRGVGHQETRARLSDFYSRSCSSVLRNRAKGWPDARSHLLDTLRINLF